MEKEYGEDPSQAVIDEVAGQWISLLFIPFSPLTVLLSFILFRLFDVLKPGPVDWAQRLPGGWGIMSDDVLAGIFANLSLQLVLLALPMLPFGVAV
jgi:phosphatidylglycerophosphatase A